MYQSDYAYPTPVLNDSTYGCTPTIFARSVNAPASITNLTSQHLRYLEANGSAPLSFFTGNAADATTNINWIMRDISAAHRIISAKEAGFTGSAIGYTGVTPAMPGRWIPSASTTWPIIDKMLTNSTVGACITFLPPTEAVNMPAANILSFNGFYPFRGSFNGYTPTINGQYTCWGFEHIMTNPDNPDPNIAVFANAFKGWLTTNLLAGSPYSIPLSKMAVTRSSTGGSVTPR